MKDKTALIELQSAANAPKEKLMAICNDLYAFGFTKEAEQLDRIIARLEIWQNK